MKRMMRKTTPVEMLDAFQERVDKLRQPSKVESSEYIGDDDEDLGGWILVETKSVQDYDGFYTDYTLWYNENVDEWVTIFGDNDLYNPTNKYSDAEFGHNEDEAYEWFESYSTEEDDDEDVF